MIADLTRASRAGISCARVGPGGVPTFSTAANDWTVTWQGKPGNATRGTSLLV
jgi:hypothetical protein